MILPQPQPTLVSSRLTLRPFSSDDVPVVVWLAGSDSVANTTLTIPHPYHPSDATKWISNHRLDYERANSANFAIAINKTAEVIGAIGLVFSPSFFKAEMGYWIGVDYWNCGYATEAAKRVLQWAFESLHLNRVFAQYFCHNPASGRVLTKLGMREEGRLRQDVYKNDSFIDIIICSILRDEYYHRLQGAFK